MIARVKILLPIELYIPRSDNLRPQEFQYLGYRTQIWPLYRVASNTTGMDRLEPAAIQTVDNVCLKGEPSIPANVFHVQFWAPDFERRLGAPDAPVVVAPAFDIADAFLARYRTLCRASDLRLPLPRTGRPYHVQYLSDSGSELVPDANLYREYFSQIHKIDATALLPSETWDAIATLPLLYEEPLHDKLILDAIGLLPDVGPALAVACTAVEVCVSAVLDALASRSTVPPELWKWITQGHGPRRHDELNALLKLLGGRALKDNRALSEAYDALVQARNSFVHRGEARTSVQAAGSSVRLAVTEGQAAMLVQAAQEVIDWIEETLPIAERRPRLPAFSIDVVRAEEFRRT